MSEHEESSPEEAIEISIKKPQAERVTREKKKIVKAKPKTRQTVGAGVRQLLEQRIEDERVLRKLESRPFDFGEQVNTVVKIADKTRSSRQLKELGISLVHVVKKEKRVGVDRRLQLLGNSGHLRKAMSHVRALVKK